MRNSFFIFPVFLATIFFSSAPFIRAAELYFGASETVVSIGAPVEVGVFLNTEGKVDNAVAGTVHFSSDQFSLSAVRDGGSGITMWIERPNEVGPGSIAFSGVTPGGFMEDKLFLFSMKLIPTGSGSSIVTYEDMEVLLNDGLGTSDSVAASPITFTIRSVPAVVEPSEQEAPSSETESRIESVSDQIPPEPFAVEYVQDSQLADGKNVLIFNAVDRDSGIDRYEVVEEYPWFDIRAWFEKSEPVVTGSPYVLIDQEQRTDVAITAVDRVGNRETTYVHAAHLPPWRFFIGTWIVACIAVLSGVIVFVLKKRKVF